MNEKCAAGTGRFLEVMARILNVELDELSDLSMKSTEEIEISNTCTVFAESEVISQLAQGIAKEDVARGADNLHPASPVWQEESVSLQSSL